MADRSQLQKLPKCAQEKKRKRTSNESCYDFEHLASQDKNFAVEWELAKKTSNVMSTFRFQRALTRAILLNVHGLRLPSLPVDRLCPPVPNRLFYCRWILDQLMPSLRDSQQLCLSPSWRLSDIRQGLDLGTGATAIYPLLLVKSDSQLHMWASEIDQDSVQSAMHNVTANSLDDRITILTIDPVKYDSRADTDDPKLGPLGQAWEAITSAKAIKEQGKDSFNLDFVMMNPPFYDTRPSEPRADGRELCPRSDLEELYPGGEEGWVYDVLRDSLVWSRDQVGWYTTMLSKKTSFRRLQSILTSWLGPGRVRSNELDVGIMTRWFLAWTYHPVNAHSAAACILRKRFPVYVQDERGRSSLQQVADRVSEFCSWVPELNLQCTSSVNSLDSVMIKISEKEGFRSDDDILTQSICQLPERARKNLRKPDWDWLAPTWIPSEGHFIVVLTLILGEWNDDPRNAIIVQLEGYGHSPQGKITVLTIGKKIEGEISRSNRRWRRMLAKQT